MNYADNHVQDLAASIYKAISKDLPDIEYEAVDYGGLSVAEMKQKLGTISAFPKVKKTRRPTEGDLDSVVMFQQTWGSTALGFGGIGGASMSTANTVVVRCGVWFAVYWNGRLGYLLRSNGAMANFMEDIARHNTPSRRNAVKIYLSNVIIPQE